MTSGKCVVGWLLVQAFVKLSSLPYTIPISFNISDAVLLMLSLVKDYWDLGLFLLSDFSLNLHANFLGCVETRPIVVVVEASVDAFIGHIKLL